MRINYSTQDDIGIIELKNPPYNLLTSPVFLDQNEIANFLNDNTLKGIIIKGAGRNFCAGADRAVLAEQIKNPIELKDLMDKGKQILNLIQSSPIPVIAAVQGSCFGAGLEIALACHFIFSSKHAMFGFPESGIKLMPGFGGTVLSGNRLKRKDIIKLILSAEMINGEDALNIGLIDQVFPGNQVFKQSLNHIHSLTANKPIHLIRTIMESINNSEFMMRDEALKIETQNFIKLARQLDFHQETK